MNVQAILCHERGSSEYLISLKSSELKIVYYKKWTEYTYFRCRKPKEKTASKIASGSILCIETGTWMSVYFFYSKKDIRRKTSVKKIPFANMQSRQYQQKSMIPADRQRLCIVIIPMYEKTFLTGLLFIHIHQYWSSSTAVTMYWSLCERKIFYSWRKKVFFIKIL